MELVKHVIEGDLWYIDNFLTDEELILLREHAYEPTGWYSTMRSPYKNILNKFIGAEMQLDEKGNATKIPTDEKYELPVWFKAIHERISSVLPGVYQPHTTLQTFKAMTQEEAKANLQEQHKKSFEHKDIDYAYDWHYEKHDEHNSGLVASFSLYINDDFKGGIVEFMHKNYVVEPKTGRLVCIPITKEWEHRVTFVEGKDRHTFYGNSYTGMDQWRFSSPDDC